MNNPNVLGRLHDEPNENSSERSSTSICTEKTIEYVSGAQGVARVQVFTSNDDEDRGGIVIRFSIEDDDCSFWPAAKITNNGVELHMCGDAESTALITALKQALIDLPESALDTRTIK